MDDKEKKDLELQRFKCYRSMCIASILCFVLIIVEFVFLIVNSFGG